MKLLRKEAAFVLVLAALFGILAYTGIALTRGNERIAMLWLPNAVAAAWLIYSRTRAAPFYILGCLLANIAVNRLVGDNWSIALGLAIANSVEIATLVLLVRKAKDAALDLAEVDTYAVLILASVVASLASATVASVVLADTGTGFSLADGQRWLIADALSLIIILPATLVFLGAWRERKSPQARDLLEWMVMVGLVTIGTMLIFTQTTFPFLFLTSPLVLYAAFRTGLVGTAVATLLITAISSAATAIGLGPIVLVRGGSELQLVAYQAFLATNFAIGFPVAALLAQRNRDRLRFRLERDEKQEVLDNIRDVIFRADANGCWSSLNPAWETLTGYKIEESLGKPTTAFLHPEDLAATHVIYPRIASGDLEEATLQQRFFDKSGECHYIEVGVKRLSGTDGEFLGTIGNIRDISLEVKQANELKDSEARFRLLAESAPVGIFRANAAGELTYINPGWAAKVGMTVEQMLGRGWLDAVADLKPLQENPPFQNFAPGDLRKRLIQFHSADGGHVWMETYNSAEFDEDGKVKGFYGAAVDVSEARQLELELREARRRAEDSAMAKSAFLANMSHEIRTPMNGVLGFTDLLQHSELDEEQRSYVQLIADSGRAMMRLLNDILDISKIEAGQMRISNDPFDLRHKLNGIVKLMEPVAEKKGLSLEIDFAPEIPPYIVGDALRLRQIVLNLLGNAIKFTEDGGVRLVAKQIESGRKLAIDVIDTGIGIPSEKLDAIFKHFTQADGTIARRFGGTGLGLTISRQLVDMMEGDISVTSTPGKGTTFTVVLPLVAAEAPEAPKGDPYSDAQKPAVEGPPLRLLIAEDNEINQRLIKALCRNAGYEPHIVGDGKAALDAVASAQARGDQFAMVLMDLQMPLMDGISATRELRARGFNAAKLPVVALTANAYPEDIERCLASGMQGHLAKPLQMCDLVKAVERFARKGEAAAAKSDGDAVDALHISDLAENYQTLKDAVREMLADLAITNIDSRWEEVASSLHQLAGIASHFGEARLGRVASEVERGMKSAGDADQRMALAKTAFEELNRPA